MIHIYVRLREYDCLDRLDHDGHIWGALPLVEERNVDDSCYHGLSGESQPEFEK